MKVNIWSIVGVSSRYDLDGDETPNIRIKLAMDHSITKEEVMRIVYDREIKNTTRNISIRTAVIIETVTI